MRSRSSRSSREASVPQRGEAHLRGCAETLYGIGCGGDVAERGVVCMNHVVARHGGHLVQPALDFRIAREIEEVGHAQLSEFRVAHKVRHADSVGVTDEW